MTTRATILQRVRSEISTGPAVALPAAPEVWPRHGPTRAAMAEQFTKEMASLQGEVIRCATIEDARRQLAELAEKAGWTSVGVMDRPLVREATVDLCRRGILPRSVGEDVSDTRMKRQDAASTELAQLSASVVEAEALLADTGSCVIACPTTEDRLLCFLPPACVVIARIEQLVEHLPAAWEKISAQAADPAARGELLIVTGPSRTSDIEKILILGVHGPKRLVLLVG